MTVTIVYVSVLSEFIEDFKSATLKNKLQSVKEAGNLRFDVLQKEEDPSTFVLYEAYENKKFAAAHKETAHYLSWRETVAPMMANPREGVHYLEVEN